MERQKQLTCFSEGLFGSPSDCLCNVGVRRKGLSFGVRKAFMATEDREGVILVPDPPNETESIQHNFLAERNSRDLKHAPPDIRTLTKGKLTDAMIGLLRELMEERRMDDEVKEYWEGFDAAETEEE